MTMYFPNQGGGGTKTFLLFGDNYFKSFVEHEELIPRLQLCHKTHTKKDVRNPVNPIYSVSHHWNHRRNASTSTSDTKFPIPVLKGAVIL